MDPCPTREEQFPRIKRSTNPNWTTLYPIIEGHKELTGSVPSLSHSVAEEQFSSVRNIADPKRTLPLPAVQADMIGTRNRTREGKRKSSTGDAPGKKKENAIVDQSHGENNWSFVQFAKSDILSMYDKLVQHFDDLDEKKQVVSPPETATYKWAEYCCSIVLARNASTVHSSFLDTWRLVGKASTGVKKLADFDFAKLEREAWSDDWKGQFFTQLWELREELEMMQYRLNMNQQVMTSLMKSKVQPAGHNFSINTEGGTNRVRFFNSNDYSGGNHLIKSQGGENDISIHNIELNTTKIYESGGSTQEHLDERGEIGGDSEYAQHELDEWDKLIKMNAYAIQLMNRTTETYVQAIGATSTQFANEQAKNSKRLTG